MATVNVQVIEATDLQPALIPAGNLQQYIKDGVSIFPVEFDYTPVTNEWKICDQDGDFSFVAPCNAIEYPSNKELKPEAQTIVAPKAFLLDAIASAKDYAAEDDLRPIMNGVYICTNGERISVAASNSKLLFSDSTVIDGANPSVSFVVPTRAAKLISALFTASGDDTLELTTDGSHLRIVTAGRTLITRLIDGRYPRYEAVIPKQITRTAVIDASRLKVGMKRVQIAANDATNQVKMSWDNGQLTLFAQDVDFSTAAKVKVQCESAEHLERFDIGVRSTFFIDAVQTIKGHNLRIEMSEENSRPLLIRPVAPDSNRLVLVMPMTLND